MSILPFTVPLDPRTRAYRGDPRDGGALWRPDQGYTWEKASFTVPVDVSDERVWDARGKYRNKFGKTLEFEGWQVLGISNPRRDRSAVAYGTTDPDRKRYVLWAKVRRRPVTFTVDVPDEDVPLYQQAGFKLT